jgi:hypothetical protein
MAYASEMLESARACDSRELIIFALWWRVYSAFQTGDVFIASRDLEEFGRMAEERREPHPLFSVKNFQACQASIRGQSEECERLAQEALAIGQNLQMQQAIGIFGTQMFTLNRELGRLNEVEPILRHFMQTTEGARAWGPVSLSFMRNWDARPKPEPNSTRSLPTISQTFHVTRIGFLA